MGGAAAFLQVAGGQRKSPQSVSSPGQGDPLSAGHHGHDLGHGPYVGAAQDRVGAGHGAEFGGHGRCAGEADGCACDVQPAVGFAGEVGAEAEGQAEEVSRSRSCSTYRAAREGAISTAAVQATATSTHRVESGAAAWVKDR